MNKSGTAVVISASSDIGSAICHRWLNNGWNVLGTYRTESEETNLLRRAGVKLFHCELEDKASIQAASSALIQTGLKWDVLELCSGSLEPVGPFVDSPIDMWEVSFQINLLSQLRLVHKLLPSRNLDNPSGACVLFLAGGGINNAPVNYSSYIVSKIALIKMCELLDAEIPDTRFVIVGPGWVKTKIHDATLKAGRNAGENYEKTIHKLNGNECTDMEKVLDCCDWLIQSQRSVVSGRNFSVVFDPWNTEELENKLLNDHNMYKLRRYGNDWKVKNGI